MATASDAGRTLTASAGKGLGGVAMTELFVPGRLCLFGEHSDWAGALRRVDPDIVPGACLITGTDQGIRAAVAPSERFEIVSPLPDGSAPELRVEMERGPLTRATERGWFRYAAGTALEVWKRFRPPGVRIQVTEADLPVARGLSSSAAICVLTVRAFNRVHGLGLDVRDEMELAYRGELSAGSPCGRMDQACAYGSRLLDLGFDGDEMTVDVLEPARPLYLLIVDLCASKDTRRILGELNRNFRSGPEPLRSRLRRALGAGNLELVARARAALGAGDAPAVGALMSEAQERFAAAVAPACPSELAAPRLHALLEDPAARELTWGGKGVGSQGDGAAQFVCRGPEARAELARLLTARAGVRCLVLTIRPAASSSSRPDAPAG